MFSCLGYKMHVIPGSLGGVKARSDVQPSADAVKLDPVSKSDV